MKRYVLVFDMDQTLWHRVKTEQEGVHFSEKFKGKPDVLNDIPQYQKLLTPCQINTLDESIFNARTGSNRSESASSFSMQSVWDTSASPAPEGLVWTLATEPMQRLIAALCDYTTINEVVNGNIKIIVYTHGHWSSGAIRAFFSVKLGATADLLIHMTIITGEMIGKEVHGITIDRNKAETVSRILSLSTERNRGCFSRGHRPMYKPQDVFFFDDDPEVLTAASRYGYVACDSRTQDFIDTLQRLEQTIGWFHVSQIMHQIPS